MVHVNIDIPDEVHKQVKVACVMQGNTLKEHIIAEIEKELEQDKR